MQRKKRIVVFAGRNGSGKETAAKHASASLKAQHHTYSDILEETYRLWGYDRNSRPDHQALSTFMRQQKGQDALAIVIDKKCREAKGDYAVVDGARRKTDLDRLMATFGQENVALIWIETPPTLRYERLKLRKEKRGEQMMTWEEFMVQEVAETEVQLDAIRGMAVYIVDNSGPPEALAPQIDTILAEIARAA